MNLFEIAVREKYRFETTKGNVTPEDLYDLPLTSNTGRPNLDAIAKNLYTQLKSGDDISFVVTEKKSDPTIQRKFDLVKYIIDTRLEENRKINQAKQSAEKRQEIMALINQKENEKLSSASIDELKAMLDSIQ